MANKGEKESSSFVSGVSEYIHTMMAESDRGCLLVGLSEISDSLGELLRLVLSAKGATADAEWLLDPTAGDRPLASLAIRTRIAACLGLIKSDNRKVIDALRRLRNEHAHGTSAFTLTDKHLSPILKLWREALADMQKYGTQVWLYWRGNNVVGYGALGTTRRPMPLPDGPYLNVAIIPYIAVQLAYQGRPRWADRDERYAGQIINDLIFKSRQFSHLYLVLR